MLLVVATGDVYRRSALKFPCVGMCCRATARAGMRFDASRLICSGKDVLRTTGMQSSQACRPCVTAL